VRKAMDPLPANDKLQYVAVSRSIVTATDCKRGVDCPSETIPRHLRR